MGNQVSEVDQNGVDHTADLKDGIAKRCAKVRIDSTHDRCSKNILVI